MVNTTVKCRISKRNIVNGSEQNHAGLRVTVENHDAISSAQMAERISESCSLTPADVLAVINSLQTEFIFDLSAGRTVSLDGIGTFSLAIGTDHPMYEGEKIKAKNICLKNITFRPAKKLLEGLIGIHFVPQQDISIPLHGEEALDALRTYMANPDYGRMISVNRVATLFHCGYTSARNRVKELCEAGILQKCPYSRNHFIPGPNFE